MTLADIDKRKQEIVAELVVVRTDITASAAVEIASIDAAIVALGGTPPVTSGDDPALLAAVQAAVSQVHATSGKLDAIDQ